MNALIAYNQRSVSPDTLTTVQNTYRSFTEHHIPLLDPQNDWRRRICALAASLTCIDTIKGYRPIDHDQRIAQVLFTLSSFHLREGLRDKHGNAYEQWYAFSPTNYENNPPTNNVMYQAVGCIALGVGLAAECIEGCDHTSFMTFIANGGAAAISCDNRIIPDITNPNVRDLRPDRHLISIFGVNQTGETITIYDPYFPDELMDQTLDIPVDILEKYTPGSIKGIAFAANETGIASMQEFKTPGTLYPEEVIRAFQ